MDVRVRVNLADGRHQVLLRAVLRKQIALHVDADLLAALESAALVRQVVVAGAHADDRELRGEASFGEFPHAARELPGKSLGDGRAFEQLCHG